VMECSENIRVGDHYMRGKRYDPATGHTLLPEMSLEQCKHRSELSYGE